MKLINACRECEKHLDQGQVLLSDEPHRSQDEGFIYFVSTCCFAPVIEEWVEVTKDEKA